jgi:hypothetical protein
LNYRFTFGPGDLLEFCLDFFEKVNDFLHQGIIPEKGERLNWEKIYAVLKINFT